MKSEMIQMYDPLEKALTINLNNHIYGSFNEIGAGQEVVSLFFKAGGASGTVAYSQSAYDMKISDSIYGKCERYVCRDRLLQMLDREYPHLEKMLEHRKDETQFFAFANTMEALNYKRTNQGQGWMGLRFQHEKGAEPSEVVVHINLHDNSPQLQQTATGFFGVNLIYAAFYLRDNQGEFLHSLMEGLGRERVEIDMISCHGPAFKHFDNRILALKLVKFGYTEATIFDPSGNVIQPSEYLYKKHSFVLRGRFRPLMKINVDMLDRGLEAFKKEEDVEHKNISVLFELTLRELEKHGELNDQDFLERVDMLSTTGNKVIISNFMRYFTIAEYLDKFNRGKKIGMVLGVERFASIFEEHWYEGMKGGILEAFGRGFGGNIKLYLYPTSNDSGEVHTLENFRPESSVRGLLNFLVDHGKVKDLQVEDHKLSQMRSWQVEKMIQLGLPGWENYIPEAVVDIIKKRKLYQQESASH
jgi:hypothetical protein